MNEVESPFSRYHNLNVILSGFVLAGLSPHHPSLVRQGDRSQFCLPTRWQF